MLHCELVDQLIANSRSIKHGCSVQTIPGLAGDPLCDPEAIIQCYKFYDMSHQNTTYLCTKPLVLNLWVKGGWGVPTYSILGWVPRWQWSDHLIKTGETLVKLSSYIRNMGGKGENSQSTSSCELVDLLFWPYLNTQNVICQLNSYNSKSSQGGGSKV